MKFPPIEPRGRSSEGVTRDYITKHVDKMVNMPYSAKSGFISDASH